ASGSLLTVDEGLMNALIFGCRSLSGFALHAFLSDHVVQQTLGELFGLLATGALKPLIGGSYAFDAIVDAHAAL
ncbi:zinc-binding dehydrogenase, partial [Escherichia coli]|nr:zinc-binding dehydrogenase [Escherichia coli]